MAVALHGDLDTLAVPELLETLAATAKSGRVHIDGDRGRGEVLMRDGLITGAVTDRVPGGPIEEVLGDLLRFGSGSFVFEPGDHSPANAAPIHPHEALEHARVLRAEWEHLETTVPSLDAHVRLVEQLVDEQVTVTAPLWPVLAALADGCTVADLAADLDLTELVALRVVHDLTTIGVAVVEAPHNNLHVDVATSSRLG